MGAFGKYPDVDMPHQGIVAMSLRARSTDRFRLRYPHHRRPLRARVAASFYQDVGE